MKKLEKFIGPGTAGIAQRIPSEEKYKIDESKKEIEGYDLSILRYNKVMPCGQNQY